MMPVLVLNNREEFPPFMKRWLMSKTLRQVRRHLCLMQKEIAAALRISTDFYRQIERGARTMPEPVLQRFCLFFGSYIGKANKKRKWTPRRIKAIRKKLGMTQAEIAALAGVSEVSWRNWETGRFIPRRNFSSIERIAALTENLHEHTRYFCE
jgi:transcriptional regulator with XRE-family HTH domain